MSGKNRAFLLKPLTAILALGMGAQAVAAISPTSPFSQVPLHLQNETHTTTSAVKPNIFVSLDNSGSMATTNDPGSGGKSRLNMLQNALIYLIDKHGQKANWVVFPTDDDSVVLPGKVPGFNTDQLRRNRGISLPARYIDDLAERPGQWKFGMNLEDLKKYVRPLENSMSSTTFNDHKGRRTRVIGYGGPSRLVASYMDGMFLLRNAMKYRCQKSYAIIFTDGGGSESSTVKPAEWPFKNNDDGSLTIQPYFTRANPQVNTHPNNDGWLQVAGLWPHNEKLKKYFSLVSYTHPNPEHLTREYNVARPGGYSGYNFYFLSKQGNKYTATDVSAVNNPYFMQFLGESAYLNDLKPEGNDAAGKSWNDPLFNGGKQNIEGFSIAWGNRDARENAFLSAAATANNNIPYSVKSEREIRNVFDKIMAAIEQDLKSSMPPQSFSSFAPALSNKDNSTKLPDMAAAVRLILENGASEIYFYKVNNQIVSDEYTTPDYSKRKALIHDGSSVQWADRFQGAKANNAFFDIPSNGRNNDEWSRALLPWLTRSVDDNTIAGMSGMALKYRSRNGTQDGPRNMGDIIGSGIQAYGVREHGRKKYLLTAANDGMVYLFKSSANTSHPYELKLNYIPAGMERESAEDTMSKHFKYIVDRDYITPRPIRDQASPIPHQYMVNGGMMIRTMDENGPEQVFMALNMGQGGRGALALNLGGPNRTDGSKMVGIDAPESEWQTSVPLFETPKGQANEQMGYPIGSPSIGRVALKRSISTDGKMKTDLTDLRQSVFVGSGVRNPVGGIANTESALYIYNAIANLNVGLPATAGGKPTPTDMAAGHLIKKITIPANIGKGGLAAPTLVDTNFDGAIDVVYAGDYGGGLYRFDLRSGNESTWTVKKIFQAAPNQPITSAPSVFRIEQNKFIVLFGTGSDLYQSDLTNQDIQAAYGIYDNLNENSPEVKTVSQLVKQNFTEGETSSNGQTYGTRKLEDNPVPADPKGWYFNLLPSERIVVQPHVLLKTAVFMTRSYKVETKQFNNSQQRDLCLQAEQSTQSSGSGWIMQVKVDNGGNLPGNNGDDLYAYIDLLRQNKGNQRNSYEGELFSGIQLKDGGLTDIYMDSSETLANGLKKATTINGQQQSGQDNPPKDNATEPKQCLPQEDNHAAVSNSNGTKGVENLYKIFGKICSDGGKIRRLSWREIF